MGDRWQGPRWRGGQRPRMASARDVDRQKGGCGAADEGKHTGGWGRSTRSVREGLVGARHCTKRKPPWAPEAAKENPDIKVGTPGNSGNARNTGKKYRKYRKYQEYRQRRKNQKYRKYWKYWHYRKCQKYQKYWKHRKCWKHQKYQKAWWAPTIRGCLYSPGVEVRGSVLAEGGGGGNGGGGLGTEEGVPRPRQASPMRVFSRSAGLGLRLTSLQVHSWCVDYVLSFFFRSQLRSAARQLNTPPLPGPPQVGVHLASFFQSAP